MLFRILLRQITVLDRTKEPGAMGEPLYLDVVAASEGQQVRPGSGILPAVMVLGSKDTTPAQIVAVYENTDQAKIHHRYRR